MEKQVRLITNALSSRPQGALLSDTKNSRSQGKDHSKAITVRSCTQLPGVNNLSKISKPLCALLEHNGSLKFDESCLHAFEELKKQLVIASIVIAPN